MKIKQVLKKYHKKVPFPITSAKIKAAGYNVEDYIMSMIAELRSCDDSSNFLTQGLTNLVCPKKGASQNDVE